MGFQGESYAGRYVPYISAAMLDQKDKQYFDLSGGLDVNIWVTPSNFE